LEEGNGEEGELASCGARKIFVPTVAAESKIQLIRSCGADVSVVEDCSAVTSPGTPTVVRTRGRLLDMR
jgi:hypothetical protein